MTLIDELREVCKGMSAADHTEFQYECMRIIVFYEDVQNIKRNYDLAKERYKSFLRKETTLESLSASLGDYLGIRKRYNEEKKQLDRVLKRTRKELKERKELGPIMDEWDVKRAAYLRNIHGEEKYIYLDVDSRLRNAKRELKQKKKGLK